MGNGQRDDDNIRRTLRTEQDELRAASYVLNNELIPTLIDENLNFCEEKGPLYNKDMYDRKLSVKGDSDFPEGTNISIGEGKSMPVNEAHSIYRKTILEIPGMKKYIGIEHLKVNPAYIFPGSESSKFFTAKDIELHRYNKIHGITNPKYSAFDSEEQELTMSEMLKLEFDGYFYDFRKMVNRKGECKIFLEIGQWEKEDRRKKILRKSNEMSNLNEENFDNLKSRCFNATEKAKKRAGIVN